MKFRASQIVLFVAGFAVLAVFGVSNASAVPGTGEVVSPATRGADPDIAPVTLDGVDTYVTVTTSANFRSQCSQNFAWIPYYVHGDTNRLGLDGACPKGDLLSNVDAQGNWIDVKWVGKEADRKTGLWAPSLFVHDGEFYLHYAGVVKGSDQRCLWALHAPSLEDLKFATRRLFACPGDRNDIAIDADMFEHDGRLFVTYRDDGGSLPRSASSIYVTEVDKNGLPIGPKQRLLHSSDLPWTHYVGSSAVLDEVVENPSLVFNDATNEWLLFFSGNGYRFSTYATGVASCGTSLLGGPRCVPLAGPNRAYIGFASARPMTGDVPIYRMPGDLEGPGGLSVFKTHYGGYAAVWHAWDMGAPNAQTPNGPAPITGRDESTRRVFATSLVMPTADRATTVRFRDGAIEARKCKDRFATVDLLIGQSPTPGDDIIVGTSGNDVIDGLGGDDLICGWGGDDIITGGNGNDIVYGGDGADSLFGGQDDDVIYGGAGPDYMDGGRGNDRCRGSRGPDTYSRCKRVLSAEPVPPIPFPAEIAPTTARTAVVVGGLAPSDSTGGDG